MAIRKRPWRWGGLTANIGLGAVVGSFGAVVGSLGVLLGPTDASATPSAKDNPCSADPRYSTLDFWVGSWSVLEGGREVASSTIERLGAGCAVLESYRQADGYSGKSLNYMDPRDGRWHQLWIDSRGAVSEFGGALGTAGIELTGETIFPGGGRAQRRMSLTPQPGGRVRQSSQISRDEGRTWQAHYALDYVAASKPSTTVPCAAPPDAGSETAVRAVAMGIVEADNGREIDRVLSFYADEAVLLPPKGVPVVGIASIRPRYEKLFAEFIPTIETRLDRVCVAGSVAFVEGHNGGQMVGREGRARPLDDDFLMVLRREAPLRWRISHLAWRSGARAAVSSEKGPSQG